MPSSHSLGSNSNFADDAVNRFRYFLEVVWGADTLTENLNFLQACLDQDLEKYLVRDFWKDHCRRYKKKPIYWLFASPNNAFQVLVYMHRMNPYTVDTIRSKYLLPHMQYLQNNIDNMQANESTLSAAEVRQLDKLRAQLQECQEYDLHVKDIADRQISIDLDDGVAVNYPKFEPIVAPIK